MWQKGKVYIMKKVCVSFETLYKENGAFLENGGCIDFYSEEDREYYDLRTDDVDKCDSILLACDGEEFYIVDENENTVILENIESNSKIHLTRQEYDIAVFQ